jgi:RHS repeat-associated protein
MTAFTGLNGTYTYGFDSMGRPLSLTKSGDPGPLASAAAYNAAGQMTGLTYGLSGVSWTETNAFNALGQLTRKTIPTVVDFEYTFSATANNGQITTQKDWITGDEQNYQYDALKRLTMAWTTGPAYGLSFGYDGFGNKLTQTVTKGSAPASSITVDANNRITGQTYDANGNMTSGASSTLTYDIDNRVVTAGGLSSENYSYDPGNKRIWKKRALGGGSFAEDVYFYGIGTGRLGIYTKSGGTYTVKSVDVRFAGKLIYTNSAWVATDRLGSIRYRKPSGAGERLDFFPYGEERPSATAQDRDKFATYMRDDTGLDYADQRYFTNTSGRFVTPDPAGDGLNWYAYAGGDPANRFDPSGLGPICYGGNGQLGPCPSSVEPTPQEKYERCKSDATDEATGTYERGIAKEFDEHNDNIANITFWGDAAIALAWAAVIVAPESGAAEAALYAALAKKASDLLQEGRRFQREAKKLEDERDSTIEKEHKGCYNTHIVNFAQVWGDPWTGFWDAYSDFGPTNWQGTNTMLAFGPPVGSASSTITYPESPSGSSSSTITYPGFGAPYSGTP